MKKLICSAALVLGLGIVAMAKADIHTYGHYSGTALHCTAVFDHVPAVTEFHPCDHVCADNATVAVLD